MVEPKIIPDNAAALEFLRKWGPEGPWALTAIAIDRKSINTCTFRPESTAAMQRWLENYNGKDNIYFHVNPTITDISKKGEREDVKSMDWLHVDVDPRVGEDVEEEQKRIRALFHENLPSTVPPPTWIIFSGGGLQAGWKLEVPVEINGEEINYEDAKRYNQQLEVVFGADNCHNLDRVLRLPGTINIPDARKLKKGRTEVLATLVEFNDNVYSIDSFKKAPELQTGPSMLTGGGIKVEVPSEVDRVQDVAELDQWDVPDRVKIIMVQGRHPDEPKEGDDSRSAWLFDFCCQLARRNVPDEVIFSIITDPDWGISDSVLENKSNAEKYALRQIQRAREHAIDPRLAYFNGKYAVIKNFGGKCLVITEVYDPSLKRTRLAKMSLETLCHAYENEQVRIGEDTKGNPKYMPAGMWWRKNPNRRQYEQVVFSPEQQVPADQYNLWQGFSVQSLPGDCSIMLDHIKSNICAGDEKNYEYLIGWLATMFQFPARPGQVAVVMRGGRGVGKGQFARAVGSLLGRHYMQISNSGHLVGNFNSHLRDLILLFADEAFYANDKKHESILKTLVTEESMAVEAKGVDVETAPNYIHLIMASNEEHVVPAGTDERRFFVLDVGEEQKQNRTYFTGLREQWENGGAEAFLHHLLTMDIGDFDVMAPPKTKALEEQKLLSLNPEEDWWYNKLQLGQITDLEDWPSEVMFMGALDDYLEYNRKHTFARRSSQSRLGMFLKKMVPGYRAYRKIVTIKVETGDGWERDKKVKAVVFSLASLEKCRERWTQVRGTQEDWPTDEEPEHLETSPVNRQPF